MVAKTFPPKPSPTSPSVTTLMEKADDCLQIAQAQRAASDEQGLNAHKLEEIAHSLEASAVEIEGKARIDTHRRWY